MMFKRGNRIVLMICFSLLLLGIPFSNVMAASKLSIYNYTTKKTTSYQGQQVKYTLNGSNINLRKTPGIIESGTALGSYQDVFVKSGLKVKHEYNKAKGTVTLSKNGTTIVLTIGSKTAYVNGKAQTMSVAPVKIKFNNENVTKILVPTRFVAENLGYTYVWNSSSSIASITAPLSLEYNNKKVSYTGTQGKVIIDGKTINLGKMPSIIIDKTALVRAKQVFSASSIDADYKYNGKTGEITLTKDEREVILTVGSKIAYVDGKERVMDTAPLVVTNLEVKTSYVMVPGSFVASYLGYDYSWNASNGTSYLSLREFEEDYDEEEQDGPELGVDPIPDRTELNWNIKEENKASYDKVNQMVNIDSLSEDTDVSGYLYHIERDTGFSGLGERYILRGSLPFNKTTFIKENNILRLHMSNTFTSDTTYNYMINNSLVETVATKYQISDNSAYVEFLLKDKNAKYEAMLSDDKMIMYLTVYPNYLQSVTTGVRGGVEFVEFTGMTPLSPIVSENGNHIILQFDYIANGVGDNFQDTPELNYINRVQMTSAPESNIISVLIETKNRAEFTLTTEDNRVILNFLEQAPEEVNTDYDAYFKLPSGVTFNMIADEDRYYKKQIAILIPGDYRDFYNNMYLSSNNSMIQNIGVSYSNGNTEIILTTSKIQGYYVESSNGGVGIHIGNPKDMYDRIVVLDAGHGGSDPGAVRSLNGVTYYEKDINFSIIQKSKDYFNGPESSIKVYYSRYDDTKVPLYDRAAFAKTVDADLFISIHMNANTKTTPKGTEIYYTSKNKAVSSSGLDSKKFAQLVLDALPGMIGTNKRNIFDNNLVVTRESAVPAILIEVGFMSNQDDLELITQESLQDDVAWSLYLILDDIFNAYPTGR